MFLSPLANTWAETSSFVTWHQVFIAS
jgi:hypothetical protein